MTLESRDANETAIIAREAGLARGLSRGQIIMIGLGGAIGTGLFMGSGIAIGYAGPGVLISYLIAAFAAMEQLDAHGRSVKIRTGKK